MTSAMSRLHRRLPLPERYPLPPREIVDSVAAPEDEELTKDVALAAHSAFGAAAGAVLGAALPRLRVASGAAGGLMVWAASYLGWLPAAGVLEPATEHPARRNMLMAGVHLLWGAATAAAFNELLLSRETMLAAGRDGDVPPERRPAPVQLRV